MSNIDDRPTLAVVGAAPKALALVAKAALEKTGWSVPRLVVLDKRGLAASWSGAHGYTEGSPLLGTPPEKDVGYPYEGGWGKSSAAVIDEMRRLSWQSYIIQSDLYSDWIGQGRLSPNHRRWDAYLRWLGEGVELEPVIVEVTSIDLLDGRWRLTAARIGGGSVTVNCDGLVLTGPGDPITVPGQEEGDVRITNGRTFWLEKEAFAASGPIEVCVIGSGETAGSIVVALLDVLAEGSFIELVSAHGVIYLRGESFLENHLYSNPFPDWPRLAERHRREFLKRTDRGVFSVQAESVLDSAENVRPVAGRVTRLERSGEKVVADIEYDGDLDRVAVDHAVVAIEFDPLWFERLLGDNARAAPSNERDCRMNGNLANQLAQNLAVRVMCSSFSEYRVSRVLPVRGGSL